MKNRKKFIIGGIIILIAVAALGYAGFMGGSTYYYEVGEYLDKGAAVASEVTRVSGEVSSDLATQDFAIHFSLLDMTGRQASLPVLYKGTVPNSFEVGRQAVVEGKLGADGVFQATNIVVKCASK